MTLLDEPPTRPAAPPTTDAPTRTPLGRWLLWSGAVLGGVALAWSGVQAADAATTTTTRATESYGAAPVVELVADGHVSVVATDGGLVQVERTQRGGFTTPEYTVDESSDRLVVRNRCDAWFGSCSGSLDVQVPAGTDVVVRTSDGAVTVAGVAGALDVLTSDGEIDVSGLGDHAVLRTSNGAILVADADGSVDARTSDGRIEVDRVGGDLAAVTSNGNLRVDTVGGDARVRTSDGSVDVAAVQGDVEAVTSNGDVTVFGTGEPVALTISTTDGRQTVDAPTDPDAARSVVIRTSDGDVAYLGPR